MNLAFLSLFCLFVYCCFEATGDRIGFEKGREGEEDDLCALPMLRAVCRLLLSISIEGIFCSGTLSGSITPFTAKDSKTICNETCDALFEFGFFFFFGGSRNWTTTTCAPSAPAVSKQVGGKSTFWWYLWLTVASFFRSAGPCIGLSRPRASRTLRPCLRSYY